MGVLTCLSEVGLPGAGPDWRPNDLVLVVLWGLAAAEDPSYLLVLVCFAVFLVNDLYGFLNWLRMQRRQEAARCYQT